MIEGGGKAWGVESGMTREHERILSLIADLANSGTVEEVDEFQVALRCDLVPPGLPRHAYVNSPARARLLRMLTRLEAEHLIYVTKNGYWRLRLTRAGRERLATLRAAPLAPPELDPPVTPGPGPTVWQAPRPALPALAPRNEHFFGGLALTMATIGAVLFFALSRLPPGPPAGRDAAVPAVVTATAPLALPTMPPPTPEPAGIAAPRTGTPPPTPATPRVFIVANTGDDGVYLRRTPQLDDRLTAFPERTRLEEIGPETTAGGIAWRHVRAPNGAEGYVPAQYTADAP